jgi:hypothetical protein
MFAFYFGCVVSPFSLVTPSPRAAPQRCLFVFGVLSTYLDHTKEETLKQNERRGSAKKTIMQVDIHAKVPRVALTEVQQMTPPSQKAMEVNVSPADRRDENTTSAVDAAGHHDAPTAHKGVSLMLKGVLMLMSVLYMYAVKLLTAPVVVASLQRLMPKGLQERGQKVLASKAVQERATALRRLFASYVNVQ